MSAQVNATEQISTIGKPSKGLLHHFPARKHRYAAVVPGYYRIQPDAPEKQPVLATRTQP